MHGPLNRRNFKKRNPAWVMGGIVVLAFVAAPIVDIDHAIAPILGINDNRFLMGYFNAASYCAIGGGLILAISCICRSAFIGFLRRYDR